MNEDQPAVLGVDSPYDRIVFESWQPIPHLTEWLPEAFGGVRVSHTSGDVVACTVEHGDRPLGDYDMSAGEYNEQLNPRFPLPGFERVYLAHLAGPTGRWLHPRHVEVSTDYNYLVCIPQNTVMTQYPALHWRSGIYTRRTSVSARPSSFHIHRPRLPLLSGYAALFQGRSRCRVP